MGRPKEHDWEIILPRDRGLAEDISELTQVLAKFGVDVTETDNGIELTPHAEDETETNS